MAGDSRREIGALAGGVDVPDRGTGAAECLVDECPGTLVRVVTPPVQHDRAIAVRLLGELCDQARLAGALGAEDRDEPAVAARGSRPRRLQPLDLAFASHERRADRGQSQREPLGFGRPRAARRPVEVGVLVEDRRLQAAQLWARLDPQLVDQYAPGTLVGGQGVALAPRSVQSDHELAPAVLAERLFRHRGLDLRDESRRLSRGQVGVDPDLDRGQP